MNSENRLVTPATAATTGTPANDGIVEFVPPVSTTSALSENPLAIVHSLLRGRYRLAVFLAALGIVIGAPVGFMLPEAQFTSTGIIRVHPIIPKILYQTEQNGVMPMLDSFLASQVALIQSRRVTGEALLQPDWKRVGQGLSPKAESEFSLSLQVTRSSPLIYVSFTDKVPATAAIAVKAVIEAYERIYAATESESDVPNLALLEARRVDLAAKLTSVASNIGLVTNDLGSASLQKMYELKLGQLIAVEAELRNAEINKTVMVGASAPTTARTKEAASISLDELFSGDPWLQELSRQKGSMDREIRILQVRYGDGHPKVADAQAVMRIIEQDIASRQAQLRREIAEASLGNGNLTRDELRTNLLRQVYKELADDAMALGKRSGEIEKLRGEADELRERLTETKNRIEQLNLEKNVSGRITIMSYGDVPYLPNKDRRIAFAAVGGLGLAVLGVGMVMLIGVSDRRMHFIDSARSRMKRVDRMLGVLPDLPDDLTEPAQASAAAYCVHRIRAMLQIRQRTTGRKIFAVTSPAPGDGKTSLAITLGLSLGACGSRTLLVDCDMDGSGLTSRFGYATRKLLGQILLGTGMISELQLQECLDVARKRGIKLGKAVRELGYVPEEAVRQVLVDQRAVSPGLVDVLGGHPLEGAIRTTGYPLLSVLPLGSAAGVHARRVSPLALRRLLDAVADRYDTVLIDCGPILGSIEASIVAAEVDGVIVVVSRGGDRAAAEQAINLLDSAGAEVEGIVFNRAEAVDLSTSTFSSSPSILSPRYGPSDQPAGFGRMERMSTNEAARR